MLIYNYVILFVNASAMTGSQFVTSLDTSYDKQEVDADEGMRYEWILGFLLCTLYKL